jgi:hypothetical protein
LEELLEEDGLPCTSPSNKGQSRIPSKKACYHYLDQINPRPALKSLQEKDKDLISINNQKRKGDLHKVLMQQYTYNTKDSSQSYPKSIVQPGETIIPNQCQTRFSGNSLQSITLHQ